MKLLKPTLTILFVALLFFGTSTIFAQQKRPPVRPVRKVATQASVPTFETLLANDRYKIYVEVRGVGQLIRSNSVSELLDPVLKLAAPPKEFKTLVKWVNTHADELMTSRMLIATWATGKDLPAAVVAIEFDSAEEASKFLPQLNTFLPKILPASEPEQPPSDDSKEDHKPREAAPPKPSYYLKQAGSLVLITPSPLTLKNLRPAGSKLLSDELTFRVARNRFTSEQLFVYVDVEGITKVEADRRQQSEEEEKKRSEEKAEQAVVNTISSDQQPDEEKGQPEPVENPPAELATPPDPATPAPTPDPISSAVGMLASSFFARESKWPEAIGVGVNFDTESFDVRALMVSSPGEKPDVIPFLPNLIPGPPIVPESPAILPADTELFASLSLDFPQIYAAMSTPASLPGQDKSPMEEVKDTALVLPFGHLEQLLKLKIKDDLLPLLGSELVISMPVKLLQDGPSRGPAPQTPSPEPSPTEQKLDAGPNLVIALSLRDKEGMKVLLPRIVDALGFKGASRLAQNERQGDTEMVSYGNMLSYAFLGNFLVLSTDVASIRHVVDSYLKHETLSSDTQFKNYTRWQPRQLQAQVYVSPALMESYKSWADQPNAFLSDQTQELLSRLSAIPQPVTYALSNDGLGTLHELHIPKNLVIMAVAGIYGESNPSPIAANERATISALYMIVNVENQYRAGEGQGSFASLEKLIENEMFSKDFIENRGYKFEVILSGNKFEVTATPIEYGKTGKTSYYIDESNVLRGADHGGGTASSSDKPIL